MSARSFALLLVEHLGKVRVGVDETDQVWISGHGVGRNEGAATLPALRQRTRIRARFQLDASDEPEQTGNVRLAAPKLMRNGRVDSLDFLEISAGRSGTDLDVRLSGELDLCSASQLREALDEAAARTPTRVFLDLERVTFIDAAGIRAILNAAEIFGPRLIVVRTPPRVMRILTLAGVQERLTFGSEAGSG